eukprot:5334508-Amphidinium_carterae.1
MPGGAFHRRGHLLLNELGYSTVAKCACCNQAGVRDAETRIFWVCQRRHSSPRTRSRIKLVAGISDQLGRLSCMVGMEG